MLTPSIKKVTSAGAEQLVNYDYTDLAAGTGYETFYMGTCAYNLTSGGRLSNQKWYSDSIYSAKSFDTSGSNYQKAQTLNFEVQFNMPRTIKGALISAIPVAIYEQAAGAEYRQYTFLTVTHSGATATTLGSTSGASYYSAGKNTNYIVDSHIIEVPQTHFKKGDYLKVQIDQWVRHTDPAGPLKSGLFAVGHDPMNRGGSDKEGVIIDFSSGAAFTGNTSTAFIQVPFKLDI